jgi:hypothetical protein
MLHAGLLCWNCVGLFLLTWSLLARAFDLPRREYNLAFHPGLTLTFLVHLVVKSVGFGLVIYGTRGTTIVHNHCTSCVALGERQSLLAFDFDLFARFHFLHLGQRDG